MIDAEKAAPEIAREAVERCALFMLWRSRRADVVCRRASDALRQAAIGAAAGSVARTSFLLWKEQLLPKHPMAEAVNYALSQWQELNVFCSDGAVASTTTSPSAR